MKLALSNRSMEPVMIRSVPTRDSVADGATTATATGSLAMPGALAGKARATLDAVSITKPSRPLSTARS